jgi:hypothetical protein
MWTVGRVYLVATAQGGNYPHSGSLRTHGEMEKPWKLAIAISLCDGFFKGPYFGDMIKKL